MAILIASTPSSAIFVKKIIAYRRKMLKETDSRVKLTNQLLSGIRVLKIYAWEAAQEAQVCSLPCIMYDWVIDVTIQHSPRMFYSYCVPCTSSACSICVPRIMCNLSLHLG